MRHFKEKIKELKQNSQLTETEKFLAFSCKYMN